MFSRSLSNQNTVPLRRSRRRFSADSTALAVCRLLPDVPAELDGLRQRLDEIDGEILALFARRQELAGAIGAYKKEHRLPIRDEAREAAVLASRGDLLPARRAQVERLMELLMELSREEQT